MNISEKKKFRKMKKQFKKIGQQAFPSMKSNEDLVFVKDIPKEKAMHLLKTACHNVKNFLPSYLKKSISSSNDCKTYSLFNRHDKRNVLVLATVIENNGPNNAAYLHEMTGFISGGYGKKLVKLLVDEYNNIYGQIALEGDGPYKLNDKLKNGVYANIPSLKFYVVEDSIWDCPAEFFYSGIDDNTIAEYLEATYSKKEQEEGN